MAAILRTPTVRPTSPFLSTVPSNSANAAFRVNLAKRSANKPRGCCLYAQFLPHSLLRPARFRKSVAFASANEATETETETPPEPEIQEAVEEDVKPEAGEDGGIAGEEAASDEAPVSPIITSLQLYKDALRDNDEAKLAEVEAFLKSIEDEKNNFEKKVISLSEELSSVRERVLRVSADFDNFRKRTERERLSLVTNAQGEVIENLLPVLDNFERAKSQIKVETEGEEKINNSYQSIYKQFVEILGAIGVVPVETIGSAFDPLFHEAIMRGDSDMFEEGIILEEYRKGFKLGDRLLRPAMVKVSAGPGPAKPDISEPAKQSEDEGGEYGGSSGEAME